MRALSLHETVDLIEKLRLTMSAAKKRAGEDYLNHTYTLLILGKSLPENIELIVKKTLNDYANLANATSLAKPNSQVETQALAIQLTSQFDNNQLYAVLETLRHSYYLDVLLLPTSFIPPKLAVFDMDSTLIATEVIDELAIKAGIGNQVKAITERAMRGELDFKQSFTQRMALLKGLSTQVLEDIKLSLPIMDGADALFKTLNEQDCYSAILSGGFTYFANHLQQRFFINEVHANVLDIKDAHLTGSVIEPVIDAQAKASILQKLTSKQNVDATQTLAVGDGANDLLMLAQAGVGIAFKAKPAVQEQAQFKLNHNGLDALCYLYSI